MTRKRQPTVETIACVPPDDDLSGFACPNEDCDDFNRFAAGNLSVCERMGKGRRIRRLYCKTCGHRFSERQGSLMAKSKLPEETVVRIVKCLAYGCSVEATADICEVDSCGEARWRRSMPVRLRIHSSVVSTIFSMSALVTTRSGR